MSDNAARRKAVKEFVKEWTGKGYEKGETQRFWLSLLQDVFGVTNPMAMMAFELPVKTITKEKGSDFIDAYIPSTKVLIEQKGSHVDLNAYSLPASPPLCGWSAWFPVSPLDCHL